MSSSEVYEYLMGVTAIQKKKKKWLPFKNNKSEQLKK